MENSSEYVHSTKSFSNVEKEFRRVFGDSTSSSTAVSQMDLRNNICTPYLAAEDQGETLACVAHSFSMALYCVLRKKCMDIKFNGSMHCVRHTPSANEIFKLASENEMKGKGISFRTMKDLLKKVYDDIILSFELDFYRVPNKVSKIRELITRGIPIMVGYQVTPEIEKFHKDFQFCKNMDFTLPTFSENESEVLSGHSVLILGFDNTRGTFTARNSWGVSWAQNGHFFIKYKDIENPNFFTDLASVTDTTIARQVQLVPL